MTLRAHPIAELFPMLSPDGLASLADDIRRNGLQLPIVTIEENGERLILDGRNRARACEIAGVVPHFSPFIGGGDPYAFVVSTNLARRHLSLEERAFIADKIATLKEGRPSEKTRPTGRVSERATQEEAAKLLNVGVRSLHRARVVREKGVPELQQAVRNGAVSLTAGAELAACRTHEEQRRMLVSNDPITADTAKPASDPEPRAFVRNGAVAKEVAQGVMRVRTNETPERIDSRKHHDKHEKVRTLTEQGFTVSDIALRTGYTKSFIHKARRAFVQPTGLLAAVIQDAEVFAESWATRATDPSLRARWSSASAEERAQLVAALESCRESALKMIRQLRKGTAHEAHQDQAL